MKLLRSTATVGGATILSRILGFVRDVVLARFFGASGTTDAFFLAFRIPNLMRRMFAEGSFSLAFVPVLSEYRAAGDRRALRDLVDHVAGTLAAILLVITAVGILAAPAVLAVFAPGWLAEGRSEFALSADMLRITFPYILLISLTALAGGILNTFERFLIPALTPVFLNLSLIGAAVLLSGRMEIPVMALAWGVLLAGVVQLLVQVPALGRLGLLPRPRWGWRHSGVRRILRLMVPTLVGSSAAQVNILIDSVIATFLVSGSVSWLYYSDRLLEFPLGVFGIALATVILPNLSRKHAQKSATEFSDTLDWALRLSLLITIPAAAGLAVLAGPILVTLFQYEAFQADDVAMSALSLVAYAVGLPAFIGVKVLAPGYFARQDPKTPVRISLVAMGTNVLMNLLFVGGMVATGFAGPHAGLALASSASAFLNAGLLYRGLRKSGVYRPNPGWVRLAATVAVATLAMVAVLSTWTPDSGIWMAMPAITRALDLLVYIVLGAAVYGLTTWIAGIRPHHFARGSR
ncbi:MAG: murein biosynthesis integral membrane protein MurJ [Xanthomonadales bacterium]|nr:murein biosynthesis integral membrane protein MurJ [Xanthomonadales bacterium]NIX12843.1 murein biosynthesis integral membrane protein MurJ [Xanthomonadales bacterium]